MAKSVIIAYETDAWHTVASQSIVGVFSSKVTAIHKLRKEYKWINRQFIEELLQWNQTQGREVNILLEEYTINKI